MSLQLGSVGWLGLYGRNRGGVGGVSGVRRSSSLRAILCFLPLLGIVENFWVGNSPLKPFFFFSYIIPLERSDSLLACLCILSDQLDLHLPLKYHCFGD